MCFLKTLMHTKRLGIKLSVGTADNSLEDCFKIIVININLLKLYIII